MGLLGKIANVVKTVVTNPVKSFVEGAKATAVVVANPVTTITKGYTAAETKTYNSSLTTNIAKIVTNTAAVALPLAKPKIVVSVAKSIIPTTTKGKVAAAVATPVVVGAVASNPLKAAEVVQDTPGALANIGANTSNFISDPSISSATKIFTDNPLSSTLLAAAAIAPILPAAIIGGSNLLDGDKTKVTQPEQPIKLIDVSSGTPVAASPTPTTAQTTSAANITNTPKKPSKRRRKARIMQNIMNQRVNVVVSAANKRYLNKTLVLKS